MNHTQAFQNLSGDSRKRANRVWCASSLQLLLACLAGLTGGWLECVRADTHVWSGAVNGNWSTVGNWTNGTAPSAGDSLVFPATAIRKIVTNNFAAGTTFGGILLQGTGYQVDGNSFGLSSSLVATNDGASTILAPITLAASLTVIVYSTGNTLTLQCPISGSGGLEKWGYGTLVLAGGAGTANTYSGTTTVYIGKLRLAKTIPNSAISGNLLIDYASWYYPYSAVVELSGAEQIQDNAVVTIRHYGTNGFAYLDLNGVGSESVGSLVSFGGYSSSIGPEIRLQAGRVIVGNNGQSSTFGGRINGTGGLTKVGSGTLTLSGNLSYSGQTFVNAGTLILSSGGNLTGPAQVYGGKLLVNANYPRFNVSTLLGGTLGGHGTVGDISCNEASGVAPGASAGRLTCNNLSFNVMSAFVVELNGTNAGTDYDQLLVQGTNSIGGAALSLQIGFSPPEGTQFLIVDNTGFGPIRGSFSGLPNGTNLWANGQQFRINYNGGSGNDVVLTAIAGPPTIASQPTNQTVTVGQSATFTVGASGTAPLSYQWRFNTAPVSGATTSSLTLNNVQTTNAGNYTVVVTNSAGSITSAVAVLTVILPPTIASQPTNQTVTVGQSATFTVGASGTVPLSYQWRFNTAPVSGATSSSLTLNNVQTTNAGNYTVVVTNSAGSITSAVAVLTVILPPTIASQPTNQTVAMGQSAMFRVGASGTTPLSYQWRFNTAPVSSATTSSLTLNNVQATNAGNYTVVVTNSAGSITSAVAVLTVIQPPTITSQPTNQTVAMGQSATFSVGASGTTPLSYQWRFNTAPVSSATTSSLTLNNVQATNAGNYTVVVTNSAGSITSAVAVLTVTNIIWVALPPTGVAATDGVLTNQIQVTWNSDARALSYELWRSSSSNLVDAGLIGQTNITAFTDDEVVAGTLYWYAVKSVGETNLSAFSISDAGFAPVYEAAPTNVAATDGTLTSSVRVAWDPVGQPGYYEVWRSAGTNQYTARRVAATTNTFWEDANATNQVLFWYWVRVPTSRLSAGDSGYSMPMPPTLAAPSGVTASRGLANVISVSWQPVQNATGYRIYRSTNSDPASAVLVGTTSDLIFHDTNLLQAAESTFNYWVETVGPAQMPSGFGAVALGTGRFLPFHELAERPPMDESWAVSIDVDLLPNEQSECQTLTDVYESRPLKLAFSVNRNPLLENLDPTVLNQIDYEVSNESESTPFFTNTIVLYGVTLPPRDPATDSYPPGQITAEPGIYIPADSTRLRVKAKLLFNTTQRSESSRTFPIQLSNPNDVVLRVYNRYRDGFLRRHLIGIGRGVANVWLKEYEPGLDRKELLFHSRTTKWAGDRTRVYVPWTYECSSSEPGKKSGGSIADGSLVLYGGDDNPLLRGGIAMASFADEYRRTRRVESLFHALALFEYVKRCEYKYPNNDLSGFFLRARGPWYIHEKSGREYFYASIDELAGMTMGLLYLREALTQAGWQDLPRDDYKGREVWNYFQQRRTEVADLADRLARSLSYYWFLIVPPENSDLPAQTHMGWEAGYLYQWFLREGLARIAWDEHHEGYFPPGKELSEVTPFLNPDERWDYIKNKLTHTADGGLTPVRLMADMNLAGAERALVAVKVLGMGMHKDYSLLREDIPRFNLPMIFHLFHLRMSNPDEWGKDNYREMRTSMGRLIYGVLDDSLVWDHIDPAHLAASVVIGDLPDIFLSPLDWLAPDAWLNVGSPFPEDDLYAAALAQRFSLDVPFDVSHRARENAIAKFPSELPAGARDVNNDFIDHNPDRKWGRLFCWEGGPEIHRDGRVEWPKRIQDGSSEGETGISNGVMDAKLGQGWDVLVEAPGMDLVYPLSLLGVGQSRCDLYENPNLRRLPALNSVPQLLAQSNPVKASYRFPSIGSDPFDQEGNRNDTLTRTLPVLEVGVTNDLTFDRATGSAGTMDEKQALYPPTARLVNMRWLGNRQEIYAESDYDFFQTIGTNVDFVVEVDADSSLHKNKIVIYVDGKKYTGLTLSGSADHIIMTTCSNDVFPYRLILRPANFVPPVPPGSSLLFLDTFSVSQQSDDVSFENNLRQTGPLAPVTYQDTSLASSQVGNPQAPGGLWLRASNATTVGVSPNRSFIESPHWALEFDVNAGADDALGVGAGWAGILFGSQRQTASSDASGGMALRFWNDSTIEVLNGSTSLYRGNAGYPGGMPKGKIHVRIEVSGGFSKDYGHPVTISMSLDGHRARFGTSGHPVSTFTRTIGFRDNFVTLAGWAGTGEAWTHMFDNLAFFDLPSAGFSPEQVSVAPGQTSSPIRVTLPGIWYSGATGTVEVAIQSLNPAIALPVGADSNGVVRLTFPPGGSMITNFQAFGLTAGSTLFDLTAPGLTLTNGLQVTVLPSASTLTVASTPAGAGIISLNPLPTGGTYPAGTTVTLTAQPADGFSFASWNGGVATSTNPLTLTVTSNLQVEARFTAWNLQAELLFADNFDVSRLTNDVSFENNLRQSGSVGILSYQDNSLESSRVGNPAAPGRLWLRPAFNSVVEVSLNHNFVEAPRWALEFDVDAGVDDPVGYPSGWAGVALGCSMQNPSATDLDGLAILFQNDGHIQILDGTNSVYEGDGGLLGGLPRGDLRARIEVQAAAFDGSPATVRLFVNGTQVRAGTNSGLEYVRAAGFRTNLITLGGYAFSNQVWTHTFDNLAVWAIRCIEVSTNQASLLAGEISSPITLAIPTMLNGASPAEITLRSLNPGIAVPVGTDSNGVLRLVFPTRGPATQLFTVQGLQAGNSAIEITGPAGTCTSGALQVSVLPQRYTLDLGASPSTGGTITATPLPEADGRYFSGTVVTLTAHATNDGPFLYWDEDAAGTNNPVTLTLSGDRSVRAVFVQPVELASTNLALSPAAGTTTRSNGVDFVVTTGGAGIAGTQDSFRYLFERRSGDFDAVVQVAQLDPSTPMAQAGLLLRQDLAPASAGFGLFVTPWQSNGTVFVQQRTLAGQPTTELAAQECLDHPLWIRLRRAGDSVSAFAAFDSTNWTLIAATDMNFNDPVYLGLATASGSTLSNTMAIYRGYRVVDQVYPLLTVSPLDATVVESGGEAARFEFKLLGTNAVPVNVTWTLSGTASNGVDYLALCSPCAGLAIPPGSNVLVLSVQPTNDAGFEGAETVALSLNPWPGIPTPNYAQATITILDDEQVMGVVRRQVFTAVPGSSIREMTDSPNYPFAPSREDCQGAMEGSYLQNGQGMHYGQRFYGWLVPPVSGEYVLFLNADDAAQVYFSADADPVNKRLILEETNPAPWRQWLGSPEHPQRSWTNFLQQGQHYFIEVLHKENSGSDYVGVAWAMPGGPAITNGSPPIAGGYFAHCPGTSIPVIIDQVQGRTNRIGSTTQLAVRASACGAFSYQWWFGTNRLAGETNSTLSFGNMQWPQTGDYAVVISSSGGAVTSRVAHLSAAGPPQIAHARHEPGRFSLELYGDPDQIVLVQASTDLHHWKTLGSCVLSNPPVLFTDTQCLLFSQRFYRLVVPSGPPWIEECRLESGRATFELVGEPGRAVVVEASTNLHQWIAIATNVLVQVPVTFRDRQNPLQTQRFYRLRLVEGQSFVPLPPSIIRQPTNQTAVAGLDAGFSVVATGNEPLAYQWRFEGSSIAGATMEHYGLKPVLSANAGAYSVVVTNIAGGVTSAVSTLTVTIPPPPVLSAVAYTPNHQFQFHLTGALGVNYIIEARTNLSLGNWVPLLTNSSPFIFVGTNASQYDQRFYRARLQ